jgi:prepilin-type N-terminal cleavage/methylation domain-containing protein
MQISPVRTSIKTKGFTLLELIIVILLISLFLSLLSVNWMGLSRKEKDTFLETLSLQVAVLREDAISSYQVRAIEFDITNNTMKAGAVDLTKGFDAFRQIDLAKGYVLKDVIINGNKITIGKTLARYYPSGLVDKTIIHFEAEKEGYYSVVIHPLTAKVEAANDYLEEIKIPEGGNTP